MAATVHHLTSLDDPRIEPYRALKDRDLARQHGLFVCEGEHLVRRLLASRFATHSVLAAEGRVDALRDDVPEGVPVYAASAEMLSRIVGFRFHLGVLACGVRPSASGLDEVLPATTLVVCPSIYNPENLGLIARTAAGLGADGLLLSDKGADPFSRRAVRVSMGAVLTLPVVRLANLAGALDVLHAEHGFERVATVLDERAVALADYRPGPRVALVLGPEAEGLDAAWRARCERWVTIPMARGTDSLNVAVAAGVVLYHVRSMR